MIKGVTKPITIFLTCVYAHTIPAREDVYEQVHALSLKQRVHMHFVHMLQRMLA